jgi:mRNA interferase HigB
MARTDLREQLLKANNYRLIALIQYLDGVLMIRFFGSHEEYDGIDAEKV